MVSLYQYPQTVTCTEIIHFYINPPVTCITKPFLAYMVSFNHPFSNRSHYEEYKLDYLPKIQTTSMLVLSLKI